MGVEWLETREASEGMSGCSSWMSFDAALKQRKWVIEEREGAERSRNVRVI